MQRSPPMSPPAHPDQTQAHENEPHKLQKLGLPIGIAFLVFTFLTPPLAGLSPEATKVALLCISMAIFWITEALPIPATALLPIIMLPLLGISPIREAAAPYADPIIYLFMGGFMLSIAMERWNLHRRIALNIIGVFGTRPRSLVLGFLVASTFISLWVSNSATAMMMIPIVMSVYALIKESQGSDFAAEFGGALVLTAAYGASIGGMGTLTSTPPNVILKGFMSKTYGIEISYAQWLGLGLPLILIALPLVYLILTRISFRVSNDEIPGLRNAIVGEKQTLGKITWPEYIVMGAFILAVTAWISRPTWKDALPLITDEVIAMLAACTLFFIPAGRQGGRGVFILDWKSVKKLPWDVLVLFGGGLSIAAAFEKTQLAVAMASSLEALGNWPALAIVFLVVAIMIVATAITSNTATAAAFLPVIAALAIAIEQPILLLAIPVAMAASADFMLPVGTPPNAIAYGSGLIPLQRMIQAGVWVNILFAILIPLVMWTVGRWVFQL